MNCAGGLARRRARARAATLRAARAGGAATLRAARGGGREPERACARGGGAARARSRRRLVPHSVRS